MLISGDREQDGGRRAATVLRLSMTEVKESNKRQECAFIQYIKARHLIYVVDETLGRVCLT